MKTVEEIDPALLLESQELIRDRYTYTDLDHPAVQEIFNICTVKKADEIAQGDGKSVSTDDEYVNIEVDEYDIPDHMEVDPSFLDTIMKDIKLPT
ncbi:MAG: hypothetical protein KJN62_08105, partial [Deltaproteobacteria bacterium]|nr:hypothetical protein [Deltaproteobacteria bacterium]